AHRLPGGWSVAVPRLLYPPDPHSGWSPAPPFLAHHRPHVYLQPGRSQFFTGTDVSILVSVLPLWSVKVVTGSCAGMSPSSTANGPTAAVRLPQLPSQSI